jgi:AcrR family transcriptional regulator
MAGAEAAVDAPEPGWRERAVARSLDAARSRAEERTQRFLDAAFALIDEKGSAEFTIQEVVERSKQSLRGFYEFFDGKDELVLALFEETLHEAVADIRGAVDAESEPVARLRAFTIRLHEWCDPIAAPRRGAHNRRAISDLWRQLAVDHSARVKAALAPVTDLLQQLLDDAQAAGAIHVRDTRRAAAWLHQSAISSWSGARLVGNPAQRLSAEETWEFCFRGLGG